MITTREKNHVTSRLSGRVKEIPSSSLEKYFDLVSSFNDVISLGLGEPDFASPPVVMDAARQSFELGKTGYTPNAGFDELREIIAQEISTRYSVAYDPCSNILVTVGSSEAMHIVMTALLEPGDAILIPEPSFVSYGPLAMLAGAEVQWVPTYAGNGFEVTAEDISRKITPHSKALLLSYPNNPTGAVLKRETLEEIRDVVVENDLLVISDEIYDRLIYGSAFERGHVCVPSLEGLFDRTILIGGFSKDYAMTGWRIGYLCAPTVIYEAVKKVHQYIVMSAPTMGQYGAMAAIRSGQVDVEKMRQSYDERRTIMLHGLRAAGLPTHEPEGAFFCFPDIRSTGLSSEEFAWKLLEEERVACIPGNAFGVSGEGFVRCCYATPRNNIIEALTRIERFIHRYQL